jgi:hypothetical protein
VEVAPSVFREVGGDKTVAFLEKDGEVVGMVGLFAFIPFYKLRWYQGAPFHFTLLGLALLLFLVALVSALRNWKRDQAGPREARWARRNLGLLGATNLAFVAGFVSIFAAGMGEIAFALPRGFYAVLALPLISTALTALAAFLAVGVWRQAYWTRGSRLLHSAGVAAAIAFVWFLNYWNLLGYRIG